MVTLKTPAEIAVIRAGGQRLAAILKTLVGRAKAGVTTRELDTLAEQLILEAGGVPSFKNYQDHSEDPPFPSTICASVNNQLVHTPATDYRLKDGDILSIDIGMRYPQDQGLYTDLATTIAIGKIPAVTAKLLVVTDQSLARGIAQVKPGKTVADISRAVQQHVESHGFSVIRRLVGHGVGYQVHEEPRVPNFVDPKQPEVMLKEGMVLAIEPMVSAGSYEIATLDDGWTVVMADGSLCAHFEHTVAVTKRGAAILTVE